MSTWVSRVMTRSWTARAFAVSASSATAGRVEGAPDWPVDVHAARKAAESRRTSERGEIISESVSGGRV
jgi:hypothetical protein